MFDPKKLLDELLGSNIPGTTGTVRDQAGKAVQMAKDNPLAAGALAAVLLGTGAGRQVTGSAVKLGGLAAIGGLAYKAYQNYKAGQQPSVEPVAKEPELLPPPSETPFHPSQAPQGESEFALTLIRAMISAAKADGHIDAEERQKILGRIGLAGLDNDASAFLDKELASPLNLDDLVSQAKTEAQRVELYTASRLAINADTRAERGYLDLLAGRLNLPDSLIDHIEATIQGATVPVAANAADALKSPW
ncbi:MULTISPECIES: tellurite resistance TerB family protein [Mesorhizobium]|uniref:Tellurite resistance TerB family protein n=1 Tax=Mesorhizobium denitrificans TaxID=2294114 RepID=A0A371XDZ5_9HYPH|nr:MULTISPECIES: tellurite resistance TerB family protein [Mesorhizobium]RFC67446.1 tellurite resistance TerB family protein [Mesorhizobium denitrificans]